MKDADGNDVPFGVLLEMVPRMTVADLEYFRDHQESSERFKRLVRQELMRREYDNYSVSTRDAWQPMQSIREE